MLRIEWYPGKWSDGCFFHSFEANNYNISVEAPVEQCPSICANTPNCTHYNHWYNGFCSFHSGNLEQAVSLRSICGIMSNRKQLGWLSKSSKPKLNVLLEIRYVNFKENSEEIIWQPQSWATNCDFMDDDIEIVNCTREKCPSVCELNSSCTHFTWSQGECFLKHTNKTIGDANSFFSYCGFMPSAGIIEKKKNLK